MKKFINNIIQSYKHIPYTIYHRKAIRVVQKQCTGGNTLNIYFHDLDKVLMYLFLPFLGTNIIGKIHRKINKHHSLNKDMSDYVIMEIIFDWESARYTKTDKPYGAREYALKFRSNMLKRMEPFLNMWDI